MKRILTFLLLIICFYSYSQNFNLTYRSKLQYPGQTLANIWGYVDSLGNEYALAGASRGLSIVNVTNPAAPFEVAQVLWPVQNGYSLWKEIKTWGKYAYVTSEAGMGLQIVDLSKLPGTILPTKQWQPMVGGITLDRIHALHIDNGYAYLYGSNVSNGGMVIADLSDPWNPTVAGNWTNNYIHDGYVRNDTMYAGSIYQGQVDFIDVTDKSNPTLFQIQTTPGAFTHNTWLSDNGKTLFTTDEVNNSYLTAFDLTDINNIVELDRFATSPRSGSIVHNTQILNDYAVNSWYRDGIDIVDVHRPQNLVEVAKYDTYPQGTGGNYDGAWGVYPYLPSGNIVVSNIDDGTVTGSDNDTGAVYVLTPNYVRAAYLEGIITDSLTSNPINGASIQIAATTANDLSTITGSYATGLTTPGTYTVNISKTGYQARSISGVSLTSALVTALNVKLFPFATGLVNYSGFDFRIHITPNPSDGIFNIEYKASGNMSASELLISDVTGRIVRSIDVENKEGSVKLESADLAPGVYFVSLINGKEHSSPVKIIKTN